MYPEVHCRIHKDSSIIPVLSRINPIPRIDTYFFKIHSNTVLPLCLELPKSLFPVSVSLKFSKHNYLLPFCLYDLPLLSKSPMWSMDLIFT